jgi:hypothetical protein
LTDGVFRSEATLLVAELCDVFSTSQNIHALQLSLLFCAFGSMAGQPRVECETCLPMKQLRDANLVANIVAVLLDIIRAAVFFGNFASPPLPHGMGISSRHRSNDFLKLAHAIHVLQFFLLGASPVEPPSNLNVNKVLMLLVKQTAAGFNASKEI